MINKPARKHWLIPVTIFLILIAGWATYRFLNRNNPDGTYFTREEILYPERGLITDRKGKILAANETQYDLLVVPDSVGALDTARFCRMIGITKKTYKKRLRVAMLRSTHRASVFEKNVPAGRMAALRSELCVFPGFVERVRTIRRYPDSAAAHLLGFVNTISPQSIKGAWGYSRPGEPAGRWGLERIYDSVLRGKKGIRYYLEDSAGFRRKPLPHASQDIPVTPGVKLITGLDLELQKFAQQLMKNKVGSIVAIDPQNGEILAWLSSPGYDPNELSGAGAAERLRKMRADSLHILVNRPMRSRNAPGSSLKPVIALAALQQGVIKPTDVFFCPKYYLAGDRQVACEHFDGRVNLRKAIAQSCNTYFCNLFAKQMRADKSGTRASFETWRSQLASFSLGRKLGIDLPNESAGQIPKASVYDKLNGGPGWNTNDLISLGIGQGELEVTPLQLANTQCIIANRGFFFSPHIARNADVLNPSLLNTREKHLVPIDAAFFEPVIDGMQDAVENGTAAGIQIPGIPFCGKTGTVENTKGKSHSIFAGFAPRKNPRIAIAVVVENAGYGASYAAPIASYLIEKYLRGKVTKPADQVNWMIAQNLMPGSLSSQVENTKH